MWEFGEHGKFCALNFLKKNFGGHKRTPIRANLKNLKLWLNSFLCVLSFFKKQVLKFLLRRAAQRKKKNNNTSLLICPAMRFRYAVGVLFAITAVAVCVLPAVVPGAAAGATGAAGTAGESSSSSSSSAAPSRVTLQPDTLQLIDDDGRQVIFHGVNVVYKTFPYLPSQDSFDPFLSFSKEDGQLLQSWGVNLIRLGSMWPGLWCM